MTAPALELGHAEFAAALAADAGHVDHGPPVAPPPPRTQDPDAPHGRAEDGTPIAPYGHKADGRPRIKPAGPGRGRSAPADDRARVVATRADTSPDSSSASAATGPDYSQELSDLGMAVWLGASSLRGGRLLFLKIPDTRPYAAVWSSQMPAMVAAWNAAARQNATVRGYVEKLGGDGSWSWMVGVGVSTVGLVSSCMEMARANPDVKAAAAAANDAELEAFISAQVAELGLEVGQLPGAEVGQAAAA
jgi:hypothetical protein